MVDSTYTLPLRIADSSGLRTFRFPHFDRTLRHFYSFVLPRVRATFVALPRFFTLRTHSAFTFTGCIVVGV